MWWHKYILPLLLPLLASMSNSIKFESGVTQKFEYEAHTLMDEPHSHMKNVGFKITATAELTPVWGDDTTQVIRLMLSDSSIQRSTMQDSSTALGYYLTNPIFFEYTDGEVGSVFLDDRDSLLAINLKKGLISLLQVKTHEWSGVLIDTSGECDVQTFYEDDILYRRKSNCRSLEISGDYSQAKQLLQVLVDGTSEANYVIKDGKLTSISGTERFHVHLDTSEYTGAQVFSSQKLVWTEDVKGAETISADSADDAVSIIGKKLATDLSYSTLATDTEPQQCEEDCHSPNELLETLRKDISDESINTEQTSAFLRLTLAFRSSTKDMILQLLRDKKNIDLVPQLLDVCAASQSLPAIQAALEVLDFGSAAIDVPERFLLALAFSTHPDSHLINAMLSIKLPKSGLADLHESYGLSLGAVLNTFCAQNNCDKSEAAESVLKYLIGRFDSCTEGGRFKENEVTCLSGALRAAGNAAHDRLLPVILKFAERSEKSIVVAALTALRKYNTTTLRDKALPTLLSIFHESNQAQDSSVRAAALTLIIRLNLTAAELTGVLRTAVNLLKHNELSVYVSKVLEDAARQNNHFRRVLSEVRQDISIVNYNNPNRALSSQYSAPLHVSDNSSAWYKLHVLHADSGVMKNSGMTIDLTDNAGNRWPVMQFELFASGLESLMSTSDSTDTQTSDDEPATAGLLLTLMDVTLRPVTFFTGSAQLMSAVWSAPTELTTALQGSYMLHDHNQRLPLQSGLSAQIQVNGAVSVQMAGLASISLWNRYAESLIRNSGALTVQGSVSINTAQFRSSVQFQMAGKSQIDFNTDVNFLDDPLLMCLRMHHPGFVVKQSTRLSECGKGFARDYRKRIWRTTRHQPKSFVLNEQLSTLCSEMRPDEDS